jgi:ribonucleoside-diphosphate reductase alpha chain
MRIFDAATNEVKQGGKRRGANMGILRVDHPDIKEFIHCKEDGGITNFNISVALTDKFMEAYKNNEDYELINPKTSEVVGKLSAREVFDEIAEGAWRTGDPGLIFIDKINNSTANPVPAIGQIEATNPCGEQPLYPFDACNLGSIFLTYFVKDGQVDWEGLKEVSRTSVRFLDNVIEVNPYPLTQIRKTVFGIRRIGLGIGGWADMLLELGIPYDSQEALDLAEKVMKTINDEAVAETKRLAKVRGAFPMFHGSIYKDSAPRRNSTVTTIAPTGTISIIAGSSSGCEPLFAIAYQHIVKDKHLDRKLTFVNPKFEEVLKQKGIYSEELMEKVAQKGIVREIQEIPEDVRKVFGTAQEISPSWHIRTQAAFQKYTENAVSKTINLDNSATVDDIKNAYLESWDTGCKGITVFRDGCKDVQVLNLGTKNGEKEEQKHEEVKTEEPLRHRPYKISGSTYRMNTPVGTAFITINEDENGDPLEVFINVGKAGSDVAAMAEALGRTLSTALKFRGGVNAKEKAREFAEQLSGIGGRRSIGFGPTKIKSLPDALAGALSVHYSFGINGYHNSPNVFGVYANNTNENNQSEVVATIPSTTDQQESLFLTATKEKVGDICPSCGAGTLVFGEGCSKCHACGHSEC